MRIYYVICLLWAALEATPAWGGLVLNKKWLEWDDFTTEISTASNSCVLTSAWVESPQPWVEAIPSWNVDGAAPVGLKVELRAGWAESESAWYNLGWWAMNTNLFPRRSEAGQKDTNAMVLTDTLRVLRPATRCEMRITVMGATNAAAVKLLALCLSDPASEQKLTKSGPLFQNGRGPGKIDVPLFSQADYSGGETKWCSPTSVAMILNRWSGHRKDLRVWPPEVARGVFDPAWPGTGNWAFNTAYAGSFPGMRAWVTRFNSIEDIERWIDCAVPVAMSVSYNLLKGRKEGGSGHLVVCVGFDKKGRVLLNDPGSKERPRLILPRATVERAWAESDRTAYLIYPEHIATPVLHSERRLKP